MMTTAINSQDTTELEEEVKAWRGLELEAEREALEDEREVRLVTVALAGLSSPRRPPKLRGTVDDSELDPHEG